MINKMITKEINYLNTKLYKLEEDLDYWKKAAFYWCDKRKISEERNTHLEAEITYWKETAEYYKNELNKTLDK